MTVPASAAAFPLVGRHLPLVTNLGLGLSVAAMGCIRAWSTNYARVRRLMLWLIPALLVLLFGSVRLVDNADSALSLLFAAALANFAIVPYTALALDPVTKTLTRTLKALGKAHPSPSAAAHIARQDKRTLLTLTAEKADALLRTKWAVLYLIKPVLAAVALGLGLYERSVA
ncbi:hypothetical protein JCM8097_004145 [Rhodosporidiobolus ruineniae]